MGSTTIASANCFVDYKAKRSGDALELHYGVMQLEDCQSMGAVEQELTTRLAENDWTLLRIMSLFDQSQLDEKKANAGEFFLRY